MLKIKINPVALGCNIIHNENDECLCINPQPLISDLFGISFSSTIATYNLGTDFPIILKKFLIQRQFLNSRGQEEISTNM